MGWLDELIDSGRSVAKSGARTKNVIDSVLTTAGIKSLSKTLEPIAKEMRNAWSEDLKGREYPQDEADYRELKRGDVIGVLRPGFEHYGIYTGYGRVIHFTSLHSDVSMENNEIMETDLSHFLRGSRSFFKIDFYRANCRIEDRRMMGGLGLGGPRFSKFLVYSREETVQRARSKLGCKKYNLLLNNCEQFAYWCRTGEEVMFQFFGYGKIPLSY